MADAILRIKTVMDIGDAASNIGALQKGLSKLKLPDKLNSSLNKNISEFYKEYDKYQRKIAEGIKTQSDQSQAEKSLNRMKTLYGAISKELNQVTKLDIDDIIDLGSGDFKHIADEISRTVKEINKIKVDKKPFEDAKAQIESLTKSKKVVGDDGILNRMLGHINKGELTEAKSALDELKKYAEKAAPRQVYSEKAKGMIAAPGTMSAEKYAALQKAIAAIEAEFGKADAKAAPLIQRLNELQKELGETKAAAGKDIIGGANDFKRTVKDVEKVTDSLKRMHQEEYSFKRQTQDIDRQIQSYFGLAQMIRKVGDIARAAFNTVKELDAAMVETAVVTNFDVSDMWGMLPEYTAQANQLGSTIKDVYEAATLYFQQGLNKQQSLGLANETLKMARIGGLQAAEATNMMTAALRGFNMEINGTSAQRINDVYSELAAITAADTKEIGSAMERTASIANSANMEFETTSAFLSQMIETTREAPENLGTAMKTIIARFQEMKQDPTKLVDSEGVAMDANKIDTALKTIGVDLTNQKGEFRDLDDVFLDISAKWDSLTQGQQRYIATIAAGSRQQSRFIAMMQNHERVIELVEAANNSAGASQKQFEKTLDSMSSKLNRLKNAWNQFTMGLMNDKLIKGGIDALTKSFTVINKIIDFLGKIPPKPFEGITKSALTLATTLGMLNIGKKMTRGTVMGVAGWWKQEGGFIKNFKQGYGAGEINKVGQETAKGFSTAFNNHFKKEGSSLIPNAIASSIKGVKGANEAFQQTFAGAYGKYSAGALKAGWTGDIENEIRAAWSKASKGVDASVFGKQDANEYINGYIEKMRSGKMNATQVARRIKGETGVDISGQQVGSASEALKKTETAAQKFGNTIANAGGAVQMFGMLLQSTPLAPFGTAISMVGMGISMLGSNIATFSTVFKTQMASNVAVTKAFGIALWESFGPIAVITAAIMALIGAYKIADYLHESQAEKLERMKDAAASASEAFDMAKQQTSELNDMLSRLEENEKSFDNLVEGTTEFNEQLVASNELVTELLQKFPMLNDPKYLSTDENGLMRINKAGIQAVKDYQKEIEAHATAMSLIQSADYSAEEKTQKAEEKEKPQKWKESDKAYQKRLDEAKLLREQAEIEREVAKKSALRTALDAKHIQNVEALSEHYADLYDNVQKTIEAEVGSDKHALRQEYADFHGYTYEKGTKKMYASDGSEIDYDDAAIKDEVVEQRVLLQFEEDAGTLDGIIEDLDSKFSEVLKGSFEGSGHVISDLLSSNIETDTDLLEKIIGDTSDLEEVVNSLKEEEIAAILGKTTDEVSQNLDTYKKETVDLLAQKASDIAEAQSESYSKLAAMMAQTTLGSLTDANQQQNQDLIARQIRDLKTSEANTLSTIGQLLQEQVGTEAMSTFIKESSNIYLEKGEKTKDSFNKILDDINWESPTSRLKGYTDAINSSDKAIHNWGRSMLGAADEANIVGAAFDEFLGGDWSELQENVDEFKNAAGEIDGAGILKAAESSKTLKTLLDSGKVSATGMAQALQGIESGKISQVSGAVLELLSSMHELTDAALEAHNIIENFDPGIDFGEGEDFVKENAEKAKEYYDNGEWGNQQLQNYIKLAAGADKWDEALRKNKGDLHETTKDLMKYVTTFKDGFQPAWDQMISGKNINGTELSKAVDQAIKEGRIDEKLEKPFKDFKVSWDENGYMQLDIGDLTTDELTAYFQEIYGVSKEYAQLLMQDLANYDGQISAKLAQNDLVKKIEDPDFQKSNVDRNGNFVLSDVDINTLKEVLSDDEWKRLAKAVGQTADELEKNSFDLIDEKTGKRKEDYDRIAKDFAKIYGSGKSSMLSLYNAKTTANELETNGKLDFSKIISTMQARGADQEQAMQTAYAIYKRGQEEDNKKTGVYDGQKIDDNLKTYEEFTSAINGLTEKSQWYEVGQSIAEGIISFIDQKNSGEENPDDYNQSEGWQKELDEEGWGLPKVVEWLGKIFQPGETNTSPPAEPETGPTSGLKSEVPDNFSAVDATIEAQITAVNDHFKNLLGGIKPDEIDTPEKQTALKELAKSTFTGIKDITPEIYNSLKAFGLSVDDAVKAGLIKEPNKELLTQVKKKAEENADAQAEASADGYEGGGGHGGKRGLQEKGPKKAQEAQETQESTYTVKTEDKQVDDTKKKVDELDAVANKGGTYTISTPGAKKLTSAAKAAKALTNTKETKTIGVKTGKVDTSSIKTASNAIDKFKPKIDVGAKDNATAKAEKWRSQIDKKSASISVSASATGSWSKDFTINVKVNKKNVGSTKISSGGKDGGGGYTGGFITPNGIQYRAKGGQIFRKNFTDTVPAMLTPGEYVQRTAAVKYFGIDFMRKINHKDLSGALQTLGSAAKGRYGRIGPKDKGGLTLTGEKGFEIAWLPSESRSMILGANGPQMIDLPNDAIVYTHEQSKNILRKRQPIEAGSHSEQTGRHKIISNPPSQKQTKTKHKDTDSSSKPSKPSKETIKIIQKAGKINAWWWNMTKKVEATQRRIDTLSKKVEKEIKAIGATIKTINGTVKKYITQLNLQISLNKKMRDKASKQLSILDTRKTSKATKKAQKQVTKDEKRLAKAKKTKGKKDDKAAKKQLEKDKKKLRKTQKGINWSDISYEVTERKKNKKGKVTKTKKTKKTRINLAPYIKKDDITGAYQVDDAAINKRFGKNKSKAKAVMEAAEKKIDDYQGKKNTAEDNITKAQEALEKLGQDLYEEFYGWKNELTKILELTKQIESAEKQISKMKAMSDLNDLTSAFDGVSNTLDFFNAQLNATVTSIKKREEAIKEQQKIVKETNSTADEKKELTRVQNKLNKSAYAKKLESDAKKKQTKADKAQNKLDKLNDKKKSLEKKKKNKKLSKNERAAAKKELKKVNKQINTQRAVRNNTRDAAKTANAKAATVEKDKISATRTATLENYKSELQNTIKAQQLAQKYIKATTNTDGTLDISLDEAQLEADRKAGNINKETYEQIKQHYDNLVEENDNLEDLYDAHISSLTDLYQSLKDLKEEYADMSEQLLDALEEQEQEQIDQFEKLSSAISDSLKDLLDEVKRRLDARRKQEDNAKTKDDISKKQQRLAALRANTAGGNQVEIAQLEKEIADAQQNYQRSLEDQLLDRLQDQADDAAKQRERQIELLSAQLAVDKASGHNIELINKYLANPEAYYNEIYELWKKAVDYENKTNARQATLDWQEFWNNLNSETGLPEKIKSTTEAIGAAKDSLDALTAVMRGRAEGLNYGGVTHQKDLSEYERNAEGAKEAHDDDYSVKDLSEGGWEKSDIVGPDPNAPTFTFQQLQEGNFTAQDFAANKISYANARTVFSAETLKTVAEYATDAKKEIQQKLETAYRNKITSVAADGKIGKEGIKAVQKAGNAAGYAARTYLQDLANRKELSWYDVIKAADAAGFSRYNMAKSFSSSNFKSGYDKFYGKGSYDKDKKNSKGSVFKYQTGGLANYTGPAWLDGTPSKPELVLNPTDTKNFLALRDVLGKAIKTSNTTNNAYGNNTYEININVDHINNDYDVDRIAERVKKDIVKSASYRNVTQVRNFR